MDKLNITCPHCGFAKEIDPTRIPDRVKKVVCPRCKEPFALPERAPQGVSMTTAESQPTQTSPAESATRPAVVAMPASTVAAADLPKAGFWIRLVASMLDSMLAGMLQVICALVLNVTASHLMGGMNPQENAAYSMLITLFGIVLSVSYGVFFIGYCGQTPGKMVLRIKVIRTCGAEISYGRAFLREVPGKFLSGLILGIGYLMVAFDDRKQGLHDRIADTYVVKL